MDFEYNEAERAFRDDVRSFLKEHLVPKEKRDRDFMKAWLRAVRKRRWVGFSWPEEYGGGGGSIIEQAILKEEMARAKAPPLGLSFMGLSWVGPAIMQYGTDAQKAEHLGPILDSKTTWCTGYSEPAHGSDLASLQCRAVRDGDDYVVNGQKTWTTGAPRADWMILLVRTEWDPQHKHDGITCLLVPLKTTPGIEIRAIKSMAGDEHFAEVFFTDARVSVENRLGEEGKGWEVTVGALANERSGIGEVTQMLDKLEKLKRFVRTRTKQGRPAHEDPIVRRRMAIFETKIAAMRYNGLRYLTRQIRGEPLSSETSINKLHRATLEIEMADLAIELAGEAGLATAASEFAIDRGAWVKAGLSWPVVVIGGGTPNIQRNIIAERLLNLPKD